MRCNFIYEEVGNNGLGSASGNTFLGLGMSALIDVFLGCIQE
jgi:hypothetical protein